MDHNELKKEFQDMQKIQGIILYLLITMLWIYIMSIFNVNMFLIVYTVTLMETIKKNLLKILTIPIQPDVNLWLA